MKGTGIEKKHSR